MLAISTDSWHYAYYEWLRGLYGCDTPAQTSLCPYCQTILWGSIFCILLSPFLLTGWLMMRLGRWLMKFQVEGTWIDAFFARIENTLIGEAIERGPENFAESPLISGLGYTIIGLMVLSACLVIVSSVVLVVSLIGFGLWNIDGVLWALWSFCSSVVLHIGWGVFWIFGLGGFILDWIGEQLSWLFTNGELWATIWNWALSIGGVLVVMGIGGIIIGYVSMIIARTRSAQKLWMALVTKINGYAAAKKARRRRVEEARMEARKKLPPIICRYCSTKNDATRDECTHCEAELLLKEIPFFLLFIGKCVDVAFVKPGVILFGKVQKLGLQEIHLLGWISIFWELIKGLKNGVCPLVEFTNSADLQKRAREGAEERNA